MATFVSTFITGFSDIISIDLPKKIPLCKILLISDGFVYYEYNGDSRDLINIKYFNNTYFILYASKNKLTFTELFNTFLKKNHYILITKGTFRIRYSKENQFQRVDKELTKKIERFILSHSKLKLDRLNPTTEFWFETRRDGFSFFGQLLSKRSFTEKNLHKGELRPEISYLLCVFSNITETSIILEPFCGYSSIPIQIVKNFNFSKLYISDIDEEKINYAKSISKLSNNNKISISLQNTFDLTNLQNASINLIITDPPWGFYEEIENIYSFYTHMFISFKRVLQKKGRIVILSARKTELEKSAKEQNLKLIRQINTLVNGKKAGVYEFIYD